MTENYIKFLEMLNEKLDKFFKIQSPYIFCKKGCAKCCQNAQYPYSEIEFEYLKQGYKTLSENTKNIIKNNIKDAIKDKTTSNKKPYTYQCPFLINNECSVYNYRGIICRTFGLLQINENGKSGSDIPFCALEGLNYSNVYDLSKKIISTEMYNKLNIETPPAAYNIHYDFLTDREFEQGYCFKFGKINSLINHIEKDLDFFEIEQ